MLKVTHVIDADFHNNLDYILTQAGETPTRKVHGFVEALAVAAVVSWGLHAWDWGGGSAKSAPVIAMVVTLLALAYFFGEHSPLSATYYTETPLSDAALRAIAESNTFPPNFKKHLARAMQQDCRLFITSESLHKAAAEYLTERRTPRPSTGEGYTAIQKFSQE